MVWSHLSILYLFSFNFNTRLLRILRISRKDLERYLDISTIPRTFGQAWKCARVATWERSRIYFEKSYVGKRNMLMH